MIMDAGRNYHIPDELWERIKPSLPPAKSKKKLENLEWMYLFS